MKRGYSIFNLTESFTGKIVKETPSCWQLMKENTKKRILFRLDQYTSPMVMFQILLVVFVESFQELLTCTSISMKMFEYRPYWKTQDKVSVVFQFCTLGSLIAFVLYNLYFTLYKARQLSLLHLNLHKEEYKHVTEEVR